MSVDNDVVLPDSAAPAEGVQVSLHPLPLLNISEHYTRVRIQNDGDLSRSRVMGALIGTQAGRELEIVNSFELAAKQDEETKEWNINHDFFVSRQAQFKQVFPTFELLGWYSVGSTPSTSDLALHTQILTYNESPIFLQLHPDAMQASGSSNSRAASKLPLDIYESVVDIAGGKSETKFVKIATEAGGYKVETYESERIAVESASKVGAASAGTAGQGGKAQQETTESTLVAGLSAQRNAISMLHSRIGGILEYLSAVQQGQTEPDHETLRQISSLVSSITSDPTSAPAASTEIPSTSSIAGNSGLTSEFEQEQNDVLLTSLLGMMTKNLEDVNVLVDKFGITQAKEQGGREDDLYGLAGHGRLNRAGGGGGGRRGFADSRSRRG